MTDQVHTLTPGPSPTAASTESKLGRGVEDTPPPVATKAHGRPSVGLRFLWPGPVLFVLLWLVMLAGGSRFLRDPGQFWHTRVGEMILTDGYFDRDPFTFTRFGETWIPHQWLGEVTMAVLYRIGGFDSLLVVAVGIVAGLYAWLGAKFVRTGLHPIFALGVTLLSLAAASTHFHVRPHLFTMIGMAATMHAVIEFENRRIGWKALLGLVPLYLVWTNTHGGMLGGLTTLGLAGVGWVVWRWLPPSALAGEGLGGDFKRLIAFAVIGVVCGLTAFITPYGTDIARTWIYINNGMSRLPEIIAEHARLNVADPKAWPLLALAAVYLVMLLGVLPNRPKVAWLIPLFWMVQAVLRVRHGALFAPVALLAMIDLWPHTRYAAWLAAKRPDVYAPPTRSARGVFVSVLLTGVVCVAVSLVCQRNGATVPLIGRGTAKLDATLWPVDLLDDLKRCEPTPGQPNRTFCEYIYGGFLIHHTPGYKVFVDDRCELFGDDWLVKFVEADGERTAEAMTDWQKEFGRFDFALTRNTTEDSGYDAYFRSSGEWLLIRKTDTASFYRRK